MSDASPRPPLALSLVPVGALFALLIVNVWVFGDNASAGPNQVALLLCALVAGTIGRFVLKLNYRDLETKAIKSIVLAMEAMIILLVVGALIGLWMLSGIVPTMLYYGIALISPGVFPVVACLVCSVVSLAIGSSWSTMGTVGVALVGIGTALGFNPGLVAGAIVSGAYFGDKMSPLSDTTNLSPAVAGTDLFTHIRNMLYTTVPAYAITLLAFGGLGLVAHEGDFEGETVTAMTAALDQAFLLHWSLLLVPVVTIGLAMLRVPAIPSLLVGGLLGALTAVLVQPAQVVAGADGNLVAAGFARIIETAYSGFLPDTGNPEVDALLNRGGMTSMVDTIFLIITAMLFGGTMESTGMLPSIAAAILRLVRGAASLVAGTIATCIVFNLTASEQYLAIVVPGRMFRKAYADFGLRQRNLSRALEDGGTVTSVLVPWNTCGAYAASVLGVATLNYAPYAFFNILCPIVAIALASAGIGVLRTAPRTPTDTSA